MNASPTPGEFGNATSEVDAMRTIDFMDAGASIDTTQARLAVSGL